MEASLELATRACWLEALACQPLADGSEYRRQEQRHCLVISNVKLACEQCGHSAVLRGTLMNASASGVLIRQRQQTAPGTLVVISIPLDAELLLLAGEVVHCTQTVGGYKIGIELRFADEGDQPG